MNERQAEYMAYRKEVYSEYPEVERFETTKKRMGRVLMGYAIVLYLFKIAVKGMDVQDTWSFASLYMGFFLQIMFISSAMRTRWKSAWLLYLLVFNELMDFFHSFRQMEINSWERVLELYRYGFANYPLEAVMDMLTWLYILLVLLFAFWLMLVPSHRRYADQADELEQEIKAYFGGR